MAFDLYNLAAQPERERMVDMLMRILKCSREWRPEHRPLLGTVIVVSGELQAQWLRALLTGRFAEISDLISIGQRGER